MIKVEFEIELSLVEVGGFEEASRAKELEDHGKVGGIAIDKVSVVILVGEKQGEEVLASGEDRGARGDELFAADVELYSSVFIKVFVCSKRGGCSGESGAIARRQRRGGDPKG